MRVGKIIWEHTRPWADGIHAERMEEFDIENSYLQRVAGFGAFHEDGSGQRMRSWSPLGDRAFDGFQRLRNLSLGHAGQPQSLEPARNHRLDADPITGVDSQRWRYTRIVVAPVHVLRRQREIDRPGLLGPG